MGTSFELILEGPDPPLGQHPRRKLGGAGKGLQQAVAGCPLMPPHDRAGRA